MTVDAAEIEVERAALSAARLAATAKANKLSRLSGFGADSLSQEYVEAILSKAVEQLQNELAIFGRIDDDQTWRVGIYGVELGGEQLVVDWRAPFARAFYNASKEDPAGLARRISYVGCIDDIFVEDFHSGEVSGSSPLLHELAKSRGETMRAAVATLQSEQDDLVRRAPTEQTVIRGGPGTGKTVVGLHRAAWLVYNHRQLIGSDNMLVVGPSDKYVQYISSVLPSLGEARIRNTTLRRLLGESPAVSALIDWPQTLDTFEESLYRPQELKIGRSKVSASDVVTVLERVSSSRLPWRGRRKGVEAGLARLAPGASMKDVRSSVSRVMPSVSAAQAFRKLNAKGVLEALGVDSALANEWRESIDGPLHDELQARFEKRPPQYAHAIVDEAQDLTALELRALRRRSPGLTMVGDDAQRSVPGAIGLAAIAQALEVEPVEMSIAYRMSSEIAMWLNELAEEHEMEVVILHGIRPSGNPVTESDDIHTIEPEMQRLKQLYETVVLIDRGDVWSHKGIEYDAVLVDARAMSPAEIYLAASRAAHELSVVHG